MSNIALWEPSRSRRSDFVNPDWQVSAALLVIPLDFPCIPSMCDGLKNRTRPAMPDAATRTSMLTLLREISLTMQKACGIAKAADCLAQGGDIPKGTEIAFEIEQLAYEATVTLDAIRLLKGSPAQN